MTSFVVASGRGGTFGKESPSFSNGPNRYWTLLSFDALSQFCVDLNTDSSYLSVWQLLGLEEALVASLYLHDDYYVIRVTNGGETYFFCNDDGYPYYAENDLDAIQQLLNQLEIWVGYNYDELLSQSQSLQEIVDPVNGYLKKIQDSLSGMNSNTTQFIIPYLETISYSLNNSGSSVAMYLESINTKLDTLIANQGGTTEGGSIDTSGIEKALTLLSSQLSTDLASLIANQDAIEEALLVLSTDLGDLGTDLGTIISNQSGVIYLLGAESTFYTDGYGILGNLETLINNQADILELLQKDGAFTTDISGIETSLTSLISKLDTILTNQQTVNTSLSKIESYLTYDGKSIANRVNAINNNLINGMKTLYAYQESMITNQQETNELLSDIVSALHMPESGLSFSASISSMELNLDLLRNALCGGGAEAGISRLDDSLNEIRHEISDLRGIASELQQDINRLLTDGVIVGLTAVSDNQTSINELLVDIVSALHMPESGLSFSASISSMELNLDLLRNALCGGGAEAGISRLDDSLNEIRHEISDLRGIASELQQDINRLLTDATDKLGTLIENQNTALTNQQEVNTTLSNIESALFDDGKSIYSRLNLINNNLVSGMKTVFSNQEAVIALLEENGTSGVDVSGIVDKQQELIDLIKDLNVTTVEKIENITIEETHEAYDVFYITDSEGNEQNLGEFSGDMLSIGGRLLNFFFRAVFDGTLDSVDNALDDMTGFYIDGSVALEGGSLWD